MTPDHSWQAKQGQGFDVARFTIDWENHTVQCPQGHTSQVWRERSAYGGRTTINVIFAPTDCQAWATHHRCAQGQNPRHLQLQPQPFYLALQGARQRQSTEFFKEQYAARAGVEGTLSQAVRAFGFRSTRYIGLAKTHLQHLLTATALNLVRVADWFEAPSHSSPKLSPFSAVMAGAS